MKKLPILTAVAIFLLTPFTLHAAPPSAEEANNIARAAFTYGFPIVEGYKTLYKQAVDQGGADYKGPMNQLGHSRALATPQDKFVVTPNSDTPYSYAWLDLRVEPIVITMPKIEANRYYSVQLIDLYTHNIGYLGTRSFGNEGGDFMIVGPSWKGAKPNGVRAVITCETEILYALFRTQLFNPADLAAVHKIQDSYAVRTFSAYLGKPAIAAAPAIEWLPLTKEMSESTDLFRYLNFLLQFCPTVSSEKELMESFAKLNIGAGKTFDAKSLPEETSTAIAAGIKAVWEDDFAGIMAQINTGKLSSGQIFGTREFLKNNYLYRFAGAKLGLYGNSREEALYPTYFVDNKGQKLDASANRYTLRFEKGQLPPAGAFWSMTMYDGKTQFLVANPLNRYLLNSTMLENFTYGDDGSLTLYVQKDSPGAAHEANWLPAPDGPFYGVMRIYVPKPVVFDGTWKQPKLEKID